MKVIEEDDFDISASFVDYPQKGFDVSRFDNYVKKMSISFKWKDQGHSWRKGRIWLQIIRGVEMILETTKTFLGIAPHDWEKVNIHLTREDAIVREFRPGDHFRFMRFIGGGGGHSLHVRDFKALVELQDHL